MDAPPIPDNPVKTQYFDVIACKKDKNPMHAAVDDFKRYTGIKAADPLAACALREVEADKDGFKILHGVPPGFIPEAMRHAHIRASQTGMPPLDRSKI